MGHGDQPPEVAAYLAKEVGMDPQILEPHHQAGAVGVSASRCQGDRRSTGDRRSVLFSQTDSKTDQSLRGRGWGSGQGGELKRVTVIGVAMAR